MRVESGIMPHAHAGVIRKTAQSASFYSKDVIAKSGWRRLGRGIGRDRSGEGKANGSGRRYGMSGERLPVSALDEAIPGMAAPCIRRLD